MRSACAATATSSSSMRSMAARTRSRPSRCITRPSPASWRTSITACPASRPRPSPPAARARRTCRSRSATPISNSVPFLAVTGNVPTSQFNRGAFQELYRHYQADFPSTVRAYCKRVFQPTRGEMVPLAVRQAWKTMVTGRPGPGGARRAVRRVPRGRGRGDAGPEGVERQHFLPLRRRSRGRREGRRHAACPPSAR